MGVFQPVNVYVPIHPFGGLDDRAAILFAFANGLGVFAADQFFCKEPFQSGFNFRTVNAGQVIPHFFPHEHPVRADIDDAALLKQPGHQLFDMRINERFAAANRDHRRVAFPGGAQAILHAHHVFEAGGVFANAAAPGAGEVAGVKRFELQHQCKTGSALQFMFDDVPGDLRRQRQWKSHTLYSFRCNSRIRLLLAVDVYCQMDPGFELELAGFYPGRAEGNSRAKCPWRRSGRRTRSGAALPAAEAAPKISVPISLASTIDRKS